jgi:hypothetical protein
VHTRVRTYIRVCVPVDARVVMSRVKIVSDFDSSHYGKITRRY